MATGNWQLATGNQANRSRAAGGQITRCFGFHSLASTVSGGVPNSRWVLLTISKTVRQTGLVKLFPRTVPGLLPQCFRACHAAKVAVTHTPPRVRKLKKLKNQPKMGSLDSWKFENVSIGGYGSPTDGIWTVPTPLLKIGCCGLKNRRVQQNTTCMVFVLCKQARYCATASSGRERLH